MKEVIIIGGGPAGLMAAYQLQQANIDYLLIEKNSLLGKKLLITGQGRCNVTNHFNTSQFISHLTIPHKRFLYSALSAFGTDQVVSFFEKNNVPLYQDGELKYFPKSNKAMDIRNVFSEEISNNVVFNTTVTSISLDKQFTIKTTRNTYKAKNIIVATGSRSYPKTGSVGEGSTFAKQLGINTTSFYPAETSVYSTFVKRNKEYLQGIAIPQSIVRIKETKISQKGDILFTHFGLSGPAIFHLSETIYHQVLQGNNTIEVSISTESEDKVRVLLENVDPKIHILKFLEGITIKRVARFLLQYLSYDNIQIGMLSQKKKNQLMNHLFHFPIRIDHVEDITRAFVNGGGILTNELNPKSFESKKIKGLYFIGEAVDIHGPIGGFNVTIAFASGYAASTHIINEK